MMGKISSATDWISTEVQHSFLSVIRTTGLIVAALPPAIIFSFAAYGALKQVIDPTGALWAAVMLGVSLEAAGVSISHNALRFFGLWRQGDVEAQRPFMAAVGFTAVYLLAGVLAIVFFDKHPTIRLTGVLAYAVAFIMYMASGLDILADERQDGTVATLKSQVKELVSEVGSLRGRLSAATAKANTAVTERDKALASVDAVVTERDTAVTERDKALAELSKLKARPVIDPDHLPAPLALYTQLVAQGVVPNGEMVERFDIGESTMKRTNAVLLKGG
jgi:hypothetical protein